MVRPCREESPLLERWHQRMTPRGGLVLGVDTQDVESDARAFIREYKLTYPHLRDKEGDECARTTASSATRRRS